MPEHQFTVAYDGEGLREGQMDVRDLAPALLGIGTLFEEANRILYGEKIAVSIKVVANFERGSFSINLVPIADGIQKVKELFSGDLATAVSNLITCLGFSGGSAVGLIKLIKWLRGKSPDSATSADNTNVSIAVGNNTIIVSQHVYKLYGSIPVRQAAQEIVKPVEMEGVDVFEVRHNQKVTENVTKEEVPYFRVPGLPEEKIEDSERIALFSITALAFKEDNKWRLSDGTNTFFVTIVDKKFLHDVDKDLISFSKGDHLKVRLRTHQKMDSEGKLVTEYVAEEIIEHRSAARQIPLPIIRPPDHE